jgi:GntR family transcriptional repressor for pyruvate dehydrogenase complex
MFRSLGHRTSLSKTVAEKIEEAIRQKKIHPGEKLPSELELCGQFNVSRTVVREALGTLRAKGLLTIMKGKGIYVRTVTGETAADPMQFYLKMHFERSYALDIVHARQVLEPAIVVLAAKNRTKEDLQRLTADLEALRNCDGSYLELANLDTQFHIDVAKASKNSLMPLLIDPIHRLMPDVKSSVYATVGDAKESAIRWHAKILNCIERGDTTSARTAMIRHLKIAEQHTEIMLRSQKKKKISV